MSNGLKRTTEAGGKLILNLHPIDQNLGFSTPDPVYLLSCCNLIYCLPSWFYLLPTLKTCDHEPQKVQDCIPGSHTEYSLGHNHLIRFIITIRFQLIFTLPDLKSIVPSWLPARRTSSFSIRQKPNRDCLTNLHNWEQRKLVTVYISQGSVSLIKPSIVFFFFFCVLWWMVEALYPQTQRKTAIIVL